MPPRFHRAVPIGPGARRLPALLAWLFLLASTPSAVHGQADGPLTHLGPVYRPLKPFPVTLWTNTSSGFTYPELSDGAFGIPALRAKLSLGVAHGCGGFRMGSLAAGTLRALYAVSGACTGLYMSSPSKRVAWGGGGGSRPRVRWRCRHPADHPSMG
jgi:hypothetical protein